LTNDVIAGLNHRWPQPGYPYEQEMYVFGFVIANWLQAASQPEHFIGGEYLSRSHAGDPGASPSLVAVPRSQERRAFDLLNRYVLSDSAWNYSPSVLNRMVYSEWEPFVTATWAYNPTPRHDFPVAEIAEQFAQDQLTRMFQPLMFERLDDLSLKAQAGSTMSLTDLFDWTQQALYGDLNNSVLHSIPLIHRSLQQWYARKLAQIWLAPDDGTPYDAQSLARAKLISLRQDLKGALTHSSLDELTRAHLESLLDVVSRALDARQVIPVSQ
jgi:hypothetical protein